MAPVDKITGSSEINSDAFDRFLFEMNRYVRGIIGILRHTYVRAQDKVRKINFNRLYLCTFSPNGMFDYLLESSR